MSARVTATAWSSSRSSGGTSWLRHALILLDSNRSDIKPWAVQARTRPGQSGDTSEEDTLHALGSLACRRALTEEIADLEQRGADPHRRRKPGLNSHHRHRAQVLIIAGVNPSGSAPWLPSPHSTEPPDPSQLRAN